MDATMEEDSMHNNNNNNNNNNNSSSSTTMEMEEVEYEDSLTITMMVTNQGELKLGMDGTVPLSQASHLTIMSRLQEKLSLPYVTIFLFVADLRCLKELKFCQISFSGQIHEYEGFAKALCFLKNLEVLRFVDCCLLNTSGSKPLEVILNGISSNNETLPKLHHLQLYAVDIDLLQTDFSVTPAALGRLVRNKPSLTYLNFEDLNLGDYHIIELAKGMEDRNCNIKILKLWCCAVSDKGMVAMARMLQKNTCVEQLELSYNDIGEIGCLAVAKSLYHNQTLKELRLVKNDRIVYGSKGQKALIDTLEWNHNIQQLLFEPTPDIDTDLGFYLFVNRHRHLLEDENVTRAELVDVLCSQRAYRTFIFRFLRANATLCND